MTYIVLLVTTTVVTTAIDIVAYCKCYYICYYYLDLIDLSISFIVYSVLGSQLAKYRGQIDEVVTIQNILPTTQVTNIPLMHQ